MNMSLNNTMKQLKRDLSDAARKQLPFAMSKAINATLADVKRNTDKRMRKVLDRPTPFTMRAFRLRYASKRNLVGAVYAQARQAEYLNYAEDGGNRRPRGRALLIPEAMRRNKYGNVARGALARRASKGNTFVASKTSPHTRHLKPGIYSRGRKGGKGKASGPARLLVSFAAKATYRRRLMFKSSAAKTSSARMPTNFAAAFGKAFRSRF